ncbi:glutamate--tRNA ligase [Candidatus Coxiella mudrowiae]|uniref:Glutamate--tRNA ligase n=1 Tax=Candidatus Coxiella mudrowiae TaxID=2054173 RepID=A0ABN4HV87_9COXI|nr:glutamate--tRNA ligase [Candidatus Coxiella mudrowiae]AKQ33308.1 Glutamate--tRNA ligase [Candidatus Coxiella mudrowiae]
MIKSRFCPSPTGLMHLGNARTALFNFLFAENKEGVFLLRIEDSDVERSKKLFEQSLQEDLLWMGLEWQEGPTKDKGKGPYHQSKRQAIYDDYYQRLEEAWYVYPCFCSEEQLKISRKIQRSAGKPPRYAGTCRSLSSEEIEKKLTEGLKPTLRFRVPDDEVVSFTDLVRGEQRFQTSDIGDFIIRRANGTSSFMFCNAIDDALMEVTHVLRGEDHLTNTPRQLLILQALGLAIPAYGHIALITGPDGSPLSKRHGSRGIKELREMGYLAEAVTNYLARLCLYYESDELLSLIDLAKGFNIKSLSKSPAKFNAQQLDYWQKKAIEGLAGDRFWQWMGEELKSKIPHDKLNLFLETVKPNIMFPQDIHYWVDVCFEDNFSLPFTPKELRHQTEGNYFEVALEGFKKFDKDLKSIIDYIKERLTLKGKTLYRPLRIALTGVEHGPELANLILLMDDKIIYKRLHEVDSENF